jgi:hypothetical protein
MRKKIYKKKNQIQTKMAHSEYSLENHIYKNKERGRGRGDE